MFSHMKLGLGAIAMSALLGAAGTASAAVCTNAGYSGADITNRVNSTTAATINSGCQVGTTTSPHSPDPQSRANADALFGITNWLIISNPFQLPNDNDGSYNIGASFFTIYDKALFMFQSADSSDSKPVNYVAYMLTAADGTTGIWDSPFDDEDCCNRPKKNVAAIKLLGQLKAPGAPSPVPLPAPFLLLGAALGGLGAVRWWRNRRAAQTA